MIRPETIRAVVERIHDPAAQDRELAALHREGMLESSPRLAEALEAIYRVILRALAEPAEGDTAVLMEICDIVESVLNP